MKLSNNSMSSSVMFAYTKPHYVLLDGLRGVVAEVSDDFACYLMLKDVGHCQHGF